MTEQGFDPRYLATESLFLPILLNHSHKVIAHGRSDTCLGRQAQGFRKDSRLAQQVLVEASHEATTELHLESQVRGKSMSDWKGILGTGNSTSTAEEQSRWEEPQASPNGWDEGIRSWFGRATDEARRLVWTGYLDLECSTKEFGFPSLGSSSEDDVD